MNYRTIAVQTMINRDMLNELEARDYLKIMVNQMAHAVAQKLIEEDLGNIDEQYSMDRMANVYTYTVHIKE